MRMKKMIAPVTCGSQIKLIKCVGTHFNLASTLTVMYKLDLQ